MQNKLQPGDPVSKPGEATAKLPGLDTGWLKFRLFSQHGKLGGTTLVQDQSNTKIEKTKYNQKSEDI